MPLKDTVKRREYHKNYYEKYWKEKKRDRVFNKRSYHLKITYGLTIEEYDRKVIEQNKQCAICKKHTEKLYVDHNHITGQVRELLCRKCNLGLGMLYDDKIIVETALNYLKKWNK
jgi:hypothetical protein